MLEFCRRGFLSNGPRIGIRGRGCGRGQRRLGFFNSLSKADNLQLLEEELEVIEREKQDIIEKINRLKK